MPWALPLVGIDVLLVVLWTIAAALAIALILDRVGAVFNGIPGVGGTIAGAMHSVAKAITGACGSLMGGIEGLVGAGIHLLARYLDKTFEQWIQHAHLILHLAELVGGALYRVSGLKALVHRLDKVVHTVLHRFVTIGRELFTLRHLVKALEHDLSKGIGEDVLPRIKSLDRRVHNLRRWATREIADAEAQAEAATADLWKWLTGVASMPITSTFADVVAVALATIGLGGLRCNSLLGALSRRGCGLWQGLEDVLGLLFDALIFTNLCDLLPELERLYAEVEAPIVDLISSAANAACAHPPAGWVELEAPPLELPQVYYTGPVPGN